MKEKDMFYIYIKVKEKLVSMVFSMELSFVAHTYDSKLKSNRRNVYLYIYKEKTG